MPELEQSINEIMEDMKQIMDKAFNDLQIIDNDEST